MLLTGGADMQSEPRNILVIHVVGLAQTMLALPALRALRRHLPKARITVVTSSSSAELLRLAGCADEVLPVGRLKHAELLRPASFLRATRALGELRRNNYDLAIELKPNTESSLILQIAQPRARLDSRRRAGDGLGFLIERLTRNMAQRQDVLIHDSHRYLKKLEPLGVRPTEAEPKLTTDRESDRSIEKLLGKHGVASGELLVGIHPGADHPAQRWRSERFESIAARMIHNFNAYVVVFAGPRERGAARRMAARLPAKRAIAIESPKLPEFVSAVARLSLLVANHSGPAHVAAAAGTPVVVVSPTSGSSPRDVLGQHVIHVRAPHLDLVSEEDVFEAACRLLKRSRADYLRVR